MNTELNITTPIPPSVNHYMGYRAVLRKGKPLAIPYKTADAVLYCKNFSDVIKNAVAEQGWDVPLDGSKHIYVDAVFYFPRKRMDCNNYWKVLLDTITETKLIWNDDDVVCERAQGIFYDSDNPRIELKIHPVPYVGVFENEQTLGMFEDRCKGCVRFTRNCAILRAAKEGRIQEEIKDDVCMKYREKKG